MTHTSTLSANFNDVTIVWGKTHVTRFDGWQGRAWPFGRKN